MDYVSPYAAVEHAAIHTPGDYYAVLGVTRTASTTEIISTYRTLARMYHPDKNAKENDTDGVIFKSIGVAHTVLSNKLTRTAYDNSAAMATYAVATPLSDQEHMQFCTKDKKPESAFSMNKCSAYQARAIITTQQVFTGASLDVPIERKVTCTFCHGTGGDSGNIDICKGCMGSGMSIRRMRRTNVDGDDSVLPDHLRTPESVHFSQGCNKCGTLGYVVSKRSGYCNPCGSRGWVILDETIKVDIPPGVPTKGYTITISDKGHATPMRPPGDVVLKVGVNWDHRFLRHGADVFVEFRIRLLDALCGFHYAGNYFGGHMEFKTEPGQVIQTGDTLRVRGSGIPFLREDGSPQKEPKECGDLIVKFRVDMPMFLDEKDQNILRVILDQTSLSTAEGNEPILENELDMREACGNARSGTKRRREGLGTEEVNEAPGGCSPM